MDAVGKEDGDIDNDGDKDASDKYLAKRRKTIAKAIKNEAVDLDEAMYHHILKGKVVASGSKSDMMKLVKKNGAPSHKGADSNYVMISQDAKVGEFVQSEETLDEKYDLYHKDFSSAMQHAYSYAKSKMGITVDPKEIDSKVATGPKKPTEGKTNKYMLKGKGGNLQIQVYNKGGSKPFELNMYKEENALIPESNDLISQTVNLITYTQMQEKQDYADVDDDASQKDVEDAAKNIIMQLRKSVSMRGDKEVEFAAIGHGYKKKVDMKIAQKALDMYNKMKPQDKTKFQTTIAKSYKDLLNAIKGK